MLSRDSLRCLIMSLVACLALIAHSPLAEATMTPAQAARPACPIRAAKDMLSFVAPSKLFQKLGRSTNPKSSSISMLMRPSRSSVDAASAAGLPSSQISLSATAITPQLGQEPAALFRRVESMVTPASAPTKTKLGVLLLNLGGPENQDDVEGFLYNLFADPDIIRLPKFVSGLQKPLATLLSKRRAPQSREAYESIGGGSPIVQYTTAQARALETELRDRLGFDDAKCYIGMRYWYPFTEQALEEIQADGVNALVILPLYPQFSISTSGSSLRVLQETFALNPDAWGPHRILHTVVPAWYNRPGYTESVAGLIREELAQYSEEEAADGGLHVLFSAHGVPQSYIAAGDPYQRQMKECVELIGANLPGDVTVHLSYQSRVGPVEWLRPYTDDVIPELGQSGVKNLVVVPISFVSEHIETLEEIDIEYRELAEENGVERWRRCPALNTDPVFIRELGAMVHDALREPTLSVSAVCVQNSCEGEFEEVDQRNKKKVASVGVTEGAEQLNGRIAMVGIFSVLLFELFSGETFAAFVGSAV